MSELETTQKLMGEGWEFVFTHPHEIDDDLCGFNFRYESYEGEYPNGTEVWKTLFGGSDDAPLALDADDIRSLIKVLADMQRRIQDANA